MYYWREVFDVGNFPIALQGVLLSGTLLSSTLGSHKNLDSSRPFDR
jgi:hypothetical protein